MISPRERPQLLSVKETPCPSLTPSSSEKWRRGRDRRQPRAPGRRLRRLGWLGVVLQPTRFPAQRYQQYARPFQDLGERSAARKPVAPRSGSPPTPPREPSGTVR